MILKMVLFSADTKSKGLDHCVPQLWTRCGINMAQNERIRLALGHQSHSKLWNLILVSYRIHKDIIHPGKSKKVERCIESIPSHGRQQENDLLHQFCSSKDT